MFSKTKLIGLLMLSLFGSASFAKAPLQVDFNKLIDEGALDRAELNQPAAEPAVDTAEAPTKNRRAVIDFIDMEVSVGTDANANVVDRN